MRLAAVLIGALFLLGAGDAAKTQLLHDDAGLTCEVIENATPSVGYGCHLHWTETEPDGGVTAAMAPLRCGQTIELCGEPIECSCPRQ